MWFAHCSFQMQRTMGIRNENIPFLRKRKANFGISVVEQQFLGWIEKKDVQISFQKKQLKLDEYLKNEEDNDQIWHRTSRHFSNLLSHFEENVHKSASKQWNLISKIRSIFYQPFLWSMKLDADFFLSKSKRKSLINDRNEEEEEEKKSWPKSNAQIIGRMKMEEMKSDISLSLKIHWLMNWQTFDSVFQLVFRGKENKLSDRSDQNNRFNQRKEIGKVPCRLQWVLD